jgi:hypothetical protein
MKSSALASKMPCAIHRDRDASDRLGGPGLEGGLPTFQGSAAGCVR